MIPMVLILALLLAPALVPSATAQTGEVTVAATYKGKGTVDDTHEILVFLFDHAPPTADSRPTGTQAVTKNGGSVTFRNLATSTPLYVVLVYDEKANYDGTSGPPPAGHPMGIHGKGGKPVPVTPGPGVKVAAVFDDSYRWGQPPPKR